MNRAECAILSENQKGHYFYEHMQHTTKIFAGLLLALAVAAQLGGGLVSTVQANSHLPNPLTKLQPPGAQPPQGIPGIGINPGQAQTTITVGPGLRPSSIAQNIAELFAKGLGWASTIFFTFAIIMILWAGVQFIIAKDDATMKAARTRLGWGLIGLTIGLLAYALPGIITQLAGGAIADITGGSNTVAQ